MKKTGWRKLEFIAKNVTDIGKAIFAVGLASYFFEKFPVEWRIAMGFLSIGLIALGITIFPEEGGDD